MAMTGNTMQDAASAGMPEGERPVRWVPLAGALALVCFALVAVTAGRLTSDRVPPVGAKPYTTLGAVSAVTGNDGTITMTDPASGAVLATYPAGPDQFVAGALRSLSRLAGQTYGPGTRAVEVIELRSGLVFLRDPANGEKISLDAFNRAKAKDLARRVAALNGGKTP